MAEQRILVELRFAPEHEKLLKDMLSALGHAAHRPGRAPSLWTTERRDVLFRNFYAEVPHEKTLEQLNALPGPKITITQLYSGIRYFRLRRNQPAKLPPAPPGTSVKQVEVRLPNDLEAQIAAFIREHGVTRCPTAACDVTTGTIPPEDQAALRKHGDPVWEQTMARRGMNIVHSQRGAIVTAKRHSRAVGR